MYGPCSVFTSALSAQEQTSQAVPDGRGQSRKAGPDRYPGGGTEEVCAQGTHWASA